MTCDEFERVLPELVGEHTLEQEAHLRSCSACADLLADLNVISEQAMLLEALDEPDPRVWESLQYALRSEGLIREQALPVSQFAKVHAIEDGDHAGSCPECSDVLAELNLISQEARLLQASDEPSPRVWNSIAIALRDHGLVRKDAPATLIPSRWRLAWMMPAAAMAILIVGTLTMQNDGRRRQIASEASVEAPMALSSMQEEESKLIQEVGEHAPALRASYEANIKAVDAYIADAEQSAKADPQDEVAQQYLRSAYDQKAMIYEMAMNRSIR
jgi:hypothetical protein